MIEEKIKLERDWNYILSFSGYFLLGFASLMVVIMACAQAGEMSSRATQDMLKIWNLFYN